jgi:hypothetical protein
LDPLGGEFAGWLGTLPEKRLVASEWTSEAQLGVGEQDQPRPAVGLFGVAHTRERPIERLFEESERLLNGLFTNDKFCLSRFGQLSLTWWRYPLRLRGRHSDLQTASLGEVAHQGGSHETAVAHSPADVRPSRRAATLGPRIAGDPGVGGHW